MRFVYAQYAHSGLGCKYVCMVRNMCKRMTHFPPSIPDKLSDVKTITQLPELSTRLFEISVEKGRSKYLSAVQLEGANKLQVKEVLDRLETVRCSDMNFYPAIELLRAAASYHISLSSKLNAFLPKTTQISRRPNQAHSGGHRRPNNSQFPWILKASPLDRNYPRRKEEGPQRSRYWSGKLIQHAAHR